ncbi:MAG: NADH-quinone oxidoreductase subunit C [Thermoleophilia bacterium]
MSPGTLRAAVGEVLAGGGRVDGLFAARGGAEVRYVCSGPGGERILSCPAPGRSVPTVVDLAPHLEWDEREARDLHGVVFEGHEPHRALVDHPGVADDWITPVVGDGVHQVAVGPVHAGVIESGHFRFHAVGERVLHVDVRLFYKHRGLERAAEGRPADEALAVIGRACGACAVANRLATAQAVEAARGLRPDDRTRRARTLLAELERLYNHLNDIGAICSGVGLAPGAMAFAALKERAQRVNLAVAGHRFLFGAVVLGGSALSVAAEVAAAARREVAAIGRAAAEGWRELLFTASLRDRVRGAGTLGRDDALRLGAVGPAARASGVRRDAREDAPRLWYPGFRAAAPEEPAGDAAARMEMRAVEIAAAVALLDELLAGPVEPGGSAPGEEPRAHGVGRVESPRGETLCAVELDGDRLRRVHLRTASFANWPAVARAAAGAILPDFPLINKSFELCYACVDR